mmetsp:Transcript_10365/g.15398  ORF Transcript_10365/g.15398 Transcript_10365/m.15398 type:complete len:205 (-) Transcript_10365:311-925(-)
MREDGTSIGTGFSIMRYISFRTHDSIATQNPVHKSINVIWTIVRTLGQPQIKVIRDTVFTGKVSVNRNRRLANVTVELEVGWIRIQILTARTGYRLTNPNNSSVIHRNTAPDYVIRVIPFRTDGKVIKISLLLSCRRIEHPPPPTLLSTSAIGTEHKVLLNKSNHFDFTRYHITLTWFTDHVLRGQHAGVVIWVRAVQCFEVIW